MRRLLRAATLLVGLALLIVGLGAMLVVGPDDTVTSGEHPLGTEVSAIATSPTLLQFYGPTLRVRVRSTTGRPVFVGIAGQVDADSYLAGTPREVIDRFSVPWSLHAHTADKRGKVRPVKPAGLSFWIAADAGTGERAISWPIRNGPYTVVVMNADASSGVAVRVRCGLVIAHAFVTAAGVTALGLLLVIGGWLLTRRSSTHRPAA